MIESEDTEAVYLAMVENQQETVNTITTMSATCKTGTQLCQGKNRRDFNISQHSLIMLHTKILSVSSAKGLFK